MKSISAAPSIPKGDGFLRGKKRKNNLYFAAAVLLMTFVYLFQLTPTRFLRPDKWVDFVSDTYSDALILGRINISPNAFSYQRLGRVCAEGAPKRSVNRNQFQDFLSGELPENYDFEPYTSHPGLQGCCFNALNSLEKGLRLSPLVRGYSFFFVNSFLFAVVICFFCRWIKTEFGLFASLGAYLLALFSTEPVTYARGLFWSMWTMFLPMTVLLGLCQYGERRGKFPTTAVFGAVLFTVALKAGCGYDFLSTVVIASWVPLLYYGLKQGDSKKTILARFIMTGAAAVLGFVFILIVNDVLLGNSNTFYKVAQRLGVGSREILVRQLDAKEYLSTCMPSYGLVFAVSPTLVLAGVYFVFSLMAADNAASFPKENYKRFALLIKITVLALLAPISWCVLARPHSLNHLNMIRFLWTIPLNLLLAASAGYLLETVHVSKRENTGREISENRLRKSGFFPKFVFTMILAAGGILTFFFVDYGYGARPYFNAPDIYRLMKNPNMDDREITNQNGNDSLFKYLYGISRDGTEVYLPNNARWRPLLNGGYVIDFPFSGEHKIVQTEVVTTPYRSQYIRLVLDPEHPLKTEFERNPVPFNVKKSP